ncbi:hypothetical protein CEE37_07135 [candidate division LCP-89 bacterium B3_LCP]|uniref:histidine kinase n=1 Tax=candidate division LCP-89 bacterium B3_LCP TaxID=2012998 RepID=A0A532V0J2_UNCL8|nr:MAG: hypothetical protein CEE37_07135 [candidate division LCP-89 bacterium B3_LCP]
MRSLRQKIAVFMGVSSLLALMLGVSLTIIHYESKVRQQSSTELAGISRLTPNAIETVGSGLASLTRTISITKDVYEPIVQDDYQSLNCFLVNFLSVNHMEYAEFTDSAGTVVLNLTDSLMAGKSSRNPLVQIALSGSTYGHGIFVENERLYVVATAPILHQGICLGTLTIGNSFNSDIIHQLGKFPGVDLAIWKDFERNALVSPGKDLVPPLSELLSAEEIDRIAAGETIIRNLTFNGNPVQSAFFTVMAMGVQKRFYLANYRSMNFLKEAGMLTLVHLVTLFLLVLILVVNHLWWISRRVTEPLQELEEFSRKLTKMDFSEQIPIRGGDEISKLAVAFNELTSKLKSSIIQKDKYAAELSDLNEKLEAQVAARTEELQHSNLRLKREVKEKDDFLRTVSHDLGAPLRNIGGLAHMIQRKYSHNLGDEGIDRLDRIRKNVSNELEMIEQLLELSRIKTRHRPKVLIDLMELLGNIRESFSYLLEEKDIRLVVLDIFPNLTAEKERIQQLFQNLIENAIKFIGNPAEPEIKIGYSETPSTYMFWVQDNGMGIPEDQQDQVFGIFQRIKNKEVSGISGKGIGLASVKTIVEMHGGDVWVESKPGEGSTFYFTLSRSLVDPGKQNDDGNDNIEAELTKVYEADTNY